MTVAQERLCEALSVLSAIAWSHPELRDELGEKSLYALKACGLIGQGNVVPAEALTACVVGRLLSYSPVTGRLVHRSRPSWLDERGIFNRKNAESFADPIGLQGYRRTGLFGRRVSAHRIAWLLSKGHWPNVIDHRNRIRDDNRLRNLRDTSQRGNCQNTDRQSRYVGVEMGSTNSFRARVQVHGKSVALGSFDTAEKAFKAYVGGLREYGVMTEPEIAELVAMSGL